jgi:hypothetical protein
LQFFFCHSFFKICLINIIFLFWLQVYHKPPTAFVEGTGGLKRVLPSKLGEDSIVAPSQVIAEPSSLIGDLLSMDLGPGKPAGDAAAAGGNVDLLSGKEFCTTFFYINLGSFSLVDTKSALKAQAKRKHCRI